MERLEQRNFFEEYPESERDQTPQDALREVLSQYIDLPALRLYASQGEELRNALRFENPPEEIVHLMAVLKEVLLPPGYTKIRSPADCAAHLMVDMGFMQQEQLKTVLLNTKNCILKIQLVYQGTLDTSNVRVAEVYREAIRLNAASLIVAHSHPSADPTPSPEDVLITREIVKVGKMLGCECLDHLVVGQGRWISMRERNLGFDSLT